MVYRDLIAILFLIGGLVGCGQKDKATGEEDEESVSIVLTTDVAEVRTETLRTVDFNYEIVSNGRISTQEVAELRFVSASAGNVPIKIFVQNGDHVKAGAAIAMLDTFLLKNSYTQAAENLQKARLDLQGVLLDQGGYTIADSASIPEVYKLALIRSGYNNAKNQYELTKYHLENATLRTPIDGMVINLFSKPYSAIDASNPFCMVINDAKLEVSFPILENELPLVKTGDRVRIQSYASPDIESGGSIAEINPSVDREGTVRIKAFVQPHSKIFNGMNVRISVFRPVGKSWVVPKTAVVLRTNKQVVFAYKNGKAAWHYVDTGEENSTHYTITSATLQEGDEIIVSGNEHLAEGTNVRLAETENSD
jgi:RND family efflux transporter MFP subunit